VAKKSFKPAHPLVYAHRGNKGNIAGQVPGRRGLVRARCETKQENFMSKRVI
jgi:hypothetical protein